MSEDAEKTNCEAEEDTSTNGGDSEPTDNDGTEKMSSEPDPLKYNETELNNILEQTDTEVLRLTLEETRPTLDTIEDFLSDIDDKAGQTLRLNTIIIGLLLTIISLSLGQNTPDITQFFNFAFFCGLAASSFSIVAALLTYTRSTITPGLAVEDIETILENGMSERVLLLSLVLSHGNWIQENGRVNQRDARTLFTSHLFLFLSMGYYALAVLWGIMRLAPNWRLWVTIGGLTILLPFIIYLPQTKFWPLLLPIWNWWAWIVERIRR